MKWSYELEEPCSQPFILRNVTVNNKELELLRKAGVNIENKQEFTNDDKNYISRQVSEYIMSHSSKNGDIGRLQNEYESIFRAIKVK